jgi:V8-like Glu-specific endopeptidase
MANSKVPDEPSLAAIAIARPSLRTRLRLLVLAIGCAALGACAARGPAPTAPTPAPGWEAAIGSLDVTDTEICTAVLVRPDTIATTSHCLRPRGRFAVPSELIFTSSASPALRAKGSAILAEGASIAPGSIKPDQAQTDWALVRITPPLTSIRPLPLAPLSPAMVRAEIARGARFYSAGYGQGAKDALRAHNGCGPLPPDPQGVTEGELFFATNCLIRLGDSGGPVILIANGQPKLVGLIVGFASAPENDGTIGIVVSARAFAPYLGADLISQLLPLGLPQKTSMN